MVFSCDLNLIPHFPATKAAVLRRRFLNPVRRTFRVYLSHLVKGHQLHDCGATSWCTDRVKVVTKGLSKPKDGPFATRPAVSSEQFCQLVRTFSLRNEFSPLAVNRRVPTSELNLAQFR